MKKYKILIALSFIYIFCFGQKEDKIRLVQSSKQKKLFICKYGDPKTMEFSNNGRTYIFKNAGLEDGKYIAYYDDSMKKDTAEIVTIKHGRINGLYQWWDDEDHYLFEEMQYKNGLPNGYAKYYFYTKEGIRLVNIEYWVKGEHDKDIQIVW